MDDTCRVGLLGATSLVGECLIPLLGEGGWQVVAFSRSGVELGGAGVLWCRLDAPLDLHPLIPILNAVDLSREAFIPPPPRSTQRTGIKGLGGGDQSAEVDICSALHLYHHPPAPSLEEGELKSTALAPPLSLYARSLGAKGGREYSSCQRDGDVQYLHQKSCIDIYAPEGERGLDGGISHWVCLAPIWVLPEYFKMLEACGARRIVVLSSTSRFTKTDSSDPGEHEIAAKLAEGEKRLRLWAEKSGVEWVILRPTLIYGRGKDKNISEIVRFIRRFGFFPLLGRAMGTRQPVHAEDVAAACAVALVSPVAANHAYNLSGGETLSYREMVGRVFAALNRRLRLLTVPLAIFRGAVACMRLLPRYRHWSAAMAERMNRDLVFDHAEATRDLNFSPRPFQLMAEDLPQ